MVFVLCSPNELCIETTPLDHHTSLQDPYISLHEMLGYIGQRENLHIPWNIDMDQGYPHYADGYNLHTPTWENLVATVVWWSVL